MVKGPGQGPVMTEAFWSEWRRELQTSEDELGVTLQNLVPPRVMSREDKLRQAEAVVDAALAFLLKNHWQRTLNQQQSARMQIDFPPVLNVRVSDILRFIERSVVNGDLTEPLLQAFDQPAWRRLWIKEESFHEDCLNYLFSPLLHARLYRRWELRQLEELKRADMGLLHFICWCALGEVIEPSDQVLVLAWSTASMLGHHPVIESHDYTRFEIARAAWENVLVQASEKFYPGVEWRPVMSQESDTALGFLATVLCNYRQTWIASTQSSLTHGIHWSTVALLVEGALVPSDPELELSRPL
jgi:hypothetical protein